MRTKPTSRGVCSERRLRQRDCWNASEIKIQELFDAHDQNGSGLLEQDEFRELLRDFNDDMVPSDQDVSLIIRLADMNHDGSISQGELHYALRAWHTYKNLDGDALRLFSEFDVDETGRLDFQELKELLTSLNGGLPVPLSEVQWVLDVADANGDGRLDRSELMGAIAAWYVHVDRRGIGLTELVREAVTRTANDSDHGKALRAGSRHMSQAVALVRRAFGGYSRVDTSASSGAAARLVDDGSAAPPSADMQDPWRQAPSSWPPLSGTAGQQGPGSWPGSQASAGSQAASSAAHTAEGEPDVGEESRAHKLLCVVASAAGKMCYACFPFFFGALLVLIGWDTQGSACPRNLDGVMLWFGAVTIALGFTMYVDGPQWARDLKVALAVILTLLNVLGLTWSYDGRIGLYLGECGPKLVLWSRFVWPTVPLCLACLGLHRCIGYVQHLRRHDDKLQKDGRG